MTQAQRVKAVVDCSQASGPSPEVLASLQAQAIALLAEGRVDEARDVARQATSITVAEAVLVPLTAEDIRQAELDAVEGAAVMARMWRSRRDGLLAASDWTQSAPDAPLTDKQRQAWAAYRQKLRDLTFDTEPEWPAAP